MDHATEFYRHFEERFCVWGTARPDLRAAIVMGSRARTDHPADPWSDLDIVIFSTDPESYLHDSAWLAELGTAVISIVSRTAGGEPEQLVLFEGGYNVDFVFQHIDLLKGAAEAGYIPEGHRRGARVLIDKAGFAAHTIPATFGMPPRRPPSAEEFAAAVARFWYIALYVARQIRRGDLWMVKLRDANLKEVLLRMLEWHSGATYGWDRDIWHMGRFLDEWAEPQAVAELHDAFAHFDAADSSRALEAAIRLFRRLAHETAVRLEIVYPETIDAQVSRMIHTMP